MKKIKLKIDGMHCTSCAMSIDGDLEDYVKGVQSARTSYAKQECEVEVEDTVTSEQIIKQIQQTGYKAQLR
ncbi:MAG TPA: cation transporter [Patescibacteria group bacterium]|nr:cation transporter [Patescibacteria group bacterium]